MSDSLHPHRGQPTRLSCPWDSPGTNTGVSCHFLLQCMKVKSESEVAQSCPTLSDPVSSVHGIFQARVLEGVPLPSPVSRSVLSNSATPQTTVTRQAPLSLGFSRQEYWSGLPFPTPEDIPKDRTWVLLRCRQTLLQVPVCIICAPVRKEPLSSPQVESTGSRGTVGRQTTYLCSSLKVHPAVVRESPLVGCKSAVREDLAPAAPARLCLKGDVCTHGTGPSGTCPRPC